jgi:hypothetical protein
MRITLTSWPRHTLTPSPQHTNCLIPGELYDRERIRRRCESSGSCPAAMAGAAARGQINLFDSVQAPQPLAIEPTWAELVTRCTKTNRQREEFLSVRHVKRDFFLSDMKNDGASMEAPIFTLATRPNLTVWDWQGKDGNRALTVAPSVLGRTTMRY